MIRVLLILALIGLILWGLAWALRWLARNKVRIRMHRAPNPRELFLVSTLFQILKTLLRVLLRR